MNPKPSKILKISLSVALAVVLLYFAFRGVDWEAFMGGLRSCGWGWVFVSMLCGMLAFFLRGLRWWLLLRPLDSSVSFLSAFEAVCVGNAANCGIPGAGEFVRCGMLSNAGLGYERVLGTVVVERMWDLISLFLILSGLTVFKWDVFGGFLMEHIISPASARLSIGLGWVLLPLLLLAAAAFWAVIQFRSKSALCAKICALFTGLWTGVKTGIHLERAGQFILYTVLIWAAYTAQSFCIISALPDFPELGALDALFLMAAGSIASVVPVPGGFGAYHFIVATAIASLYALPWDSGILFATLAHESQAVTMLLSGLLCYIAFKFRAKNTHI